MNLFPVKENGARIVFGLFVFFVSVCTVSPAAAQSLVARSYSYDAISYDIRVRQDSTVDVSERQTYRFIGEYHQGWRNIPMNKIDALTDISVIDGDTGIPLVHSSKRLEKTDSRNWGKYVTFRQNGEQIVEWYYDAHDTTKTFVLNYTVHGAIGFYKDHDEFYWNLLTDYGVPVERIEAAVTLPEKTDPKMLHASVYVDPTNIVGIWKPENGDGFRFLFGVVPSHGKVTIAPGWPKGLVDEGAYWKDFLMGIWGYLGAGIAVFLSVITLLFRWYITERYHAGRGTIVPEYEPPRNLRPAEAEIIITERLTDKAWSATVVDLAVRGFIGIREEPWTLFAAGNLIPEGAVHRIVVGCTFLPLLFFFGMMFLFTPLAVKGVVLCVVLIFVITIHEKGLKLANLFPPDYVLTRMFPATDGALESYEEKFLTLLFPNGKTFSTKSMRVDRQASMRLMQAIQSLRDDILDETVVDTAGYEVGFRAWKYAKTGMFVVGIALLAFLVPMLQQPQSVFFGVVFAFCLMVVVLFFRYNPRLNREGQILREEWLGFKRYLETAEKYRMQNLTPETFEKYLPYAIIFGVEKKWGTAFDGIAVENPSWYSHGVSGAAFASVSPASTFSASAFSSSFVSSFSSAFARSGGSSGGGASGGGGSAGGGGGGGGGGAS